jgi:cell division protein FtsW
MYINKAEESYKGVKIDSTLLSLFLVLLAIGLVMVASSSMDIANEKLKYPLHIFIHHLLFACLGLLSLICMLFLPIDKIKQSNWLAILASIILLSTVLIFGREVNGSMRWLSLGVISFQPSELAKLLVLVYIAGYLERHLNNLRLSWIWFIKPFIVLMVIASLLLSEPDFGATITIISATMGMIFMARAKLNHFFILLLFALSGIAALVIVEPYRLVRITSYMDPWANAFGSGYQLTQSLIAIGRGGWFGLGLGNSIQKLFYLPEAHNDFIFSVIAEELGLIGCCLLIAIYLTISIRTLTIAKRAENQGLLFHSYLAYGITFLFVSQVVTNIGVNIGILPTKGLSLPLISYGGSNLVINCINFGILLRINHELQ